MKVTAELADRVTLRIKDGRGVVDDWEEKLWDDIAFWTRGELDTTQTDILFNMIVLRWNRNAQPSLNANMRTPA